MFLRFDALYIRTVASVNAYFVADIAEEGHANLSAGFKGCGFESVGSCVAFDAGFCICECGWQ